MIQWPEIMLRLLLAAFFGAMIGLERERKDWAAGMRTHMMVCVGASLIMIVSAYGFSDVLGGKNITLDPSRVAAQVISGIGFIGAGSILFLRQGVVRGLTTASGLWTVAAIGLATGGGMYAAAFIATVLAIFILWVLQPLEKRLSNRFRQASIKITTGQKEKSAEVVNSLFQQGGLEVSSCSIEKAENDFLITVRFKTKDKQQLASLMNRFQLDDAIKEVYWSN